MQITSNAVGGSAHFLSDAAHAEQAQHDATNSPESALLRQGIIIVGGAPATENKGKGATGPKENISLNFGQVSLAYAQKAGGTGVNPEPPATTSSSMASFVPTGGLHPVSHGSKHLLGSRLDRVALNPQPLPPKTADELSHISKPTVRDLMPANHLDSMSEMGEMESFRLQMAMDMLSKIMSTLSNLLQKQSQTADAITQNIK
jgi:hypothetical protein